MAVDRRKASVDSRLKECLVAKWNEYLSANENLVDQKKCHDDIEKEMSKIQTELDLIFRQREQPAGKSKDDCDARKHEELLENKLHVVRRLPNIGIYDSFRRGERPGFTETRAFRWRYNSIIFCV